MPEVNISCTKQCVWNHTLHSLQGGTFGQLVRLYPKTGLDRQVTLHAHSFQVLQTLTHM